MPAMLDPSTSLAVNVELSTYPSSIRHSISSRSDSSAYSATAVPPPDGSLLSKKSKGSFIQDALAIPIAPSPVTQPANAIHSNYIYPPLLLLSEILSTPSSFSPTILLTTFSMFCSFFSLSSFSPSTNTPSPIPNPHFLDKLLPHLLLTTVTSPSFILNSIRTAKKALFPNGYPGPPIDPTPGEQAEMKRRLLAWRGGGSLGMFYFVKKLSFIFFLSLFGWLKADVFFSFSPLDALALGPEPLTNDQRCSRTAKRRIR